MNYLTASQLGTIKRRWRIYTWAVAKVNIPARWAFSLAGIHYRESGLADDAKNEPGGPFCLDPEGEGDQLQRIVEYSRSVCVKYGHTADDLSLEADFPTAALVAAHELRGKASRPIGDTVEELGLAIAKYNGFPRYYCEMWQTGMGSTKPAVKWHPYASNDPLNGVKLYRAGTMLTPSGVPMPVPKALDANAGALVIALELRARWSEWYSQGDECGGPA